jgi:hypothetical protein
MARDTGRKVKKHGRIPGRIRTKVRYEYADGPEQERAFEILAQLLADCSRRVKAREEESMEPNGGVIRSPEKQADIDMSSYYVYTTRGSGS